MRLITVYSNVKKSITFELTASGLKASAPDIQQIYVLLNPDLSPCPLSDYLKQEGFRVITLVYRGKKDFFRVIWQLVTLFRVQKPDVVHSHLLEAGLTASIAAKLSGVKHRVYTRHHGSMHHDYSPHAVALDQLINALSTHIIAISENVRSVLVNLDHASADKITVIGHSIDTESLVNPNPKTVQVLTQKYNIEGHYPVIGVISRYTALKGFDYIIPALGKFVACYPNTKIVLANARGDAQFHVQNLLNRYLPDPNHYVEIPFETELAALYSLFDIFIHAPVNQQVEAFGLTYPEALAAGVPSVFTLSGVARDFIQHERNALVVPFRDEEAIFQALCRLIQDPDLYQRLKTQGRVDVKARFAPQVMVDALSEFYRRLMA